MLISPQDYFNPGQLTHLRNDVIAAGTYLDKIKVPHQYITAANIYLTDNGPNARAKLADYSLLSKGNSAYFKCLSGDCKE